MRILVEFRLLYQMVVIPSVLSESEEFPSAEVNRR